MAFVRGLFISFGVFPMFQSSILESRKNVRVSSIGASEVSARNLIADSAFAPKKDALYSCPGTLLLHHGAPIYWKSTRQKLKAHSACQAEYIAASDGIAAVERMGFLG